MGGAARHMAKKVTKEQYETLQSEYLACQRKLQSKDEAVKILRKELELCQEEKEEYGKLMNHMKDYIVDGQSSLPTTSIDTENESDSKRLSQLEAYVHQLKQQHKEEVQSLKDKLSYARNALATTSSISCSELAEERSRLVAQLEATQAEILELQRQVQSLEDEKEDLLSERDHFSAKCSSLTKCLEERNNTKPPALSTLEQLLEENRQLKMELLETQAEKESANNKIERYKRAVERRKMKESQNETLHMNSDKVSELRQSMKRVQELDSLANSLSEEVKEKSLALAHQRKTNRLLGTRIADLEHRLKVLEISGLWSTNASGDDIPQIEQYEATITFEDEKEEDKSTEINGIKKDSLDTSTESNTHSSDTPYLQYTHISSLKSATNIPVKNITSNDDTWIGRVQECDTKKNQFRQMETMT